MSQHYFHTKHNNTEITVLMGWDRPLQGYFMVISDKNKRGDEYIYSNLEDPQLCDAGGLAETIEPFVNKLNELGIEVPFDMLFGVELDGAFNEGNRQVTHEQDDGPSMNCEKGDSH
jgi:hypothetical protein